MNYFLFLDESGDHGLSNVDAAFPVFVLCGLLINQDNYFVARDLLNEVKNKFWGNKSVIFHSRDIRKCEKEFKILFDLDIKRQFYNRLDDVVTNTEYTIIAAAINKDDYIKKYGKLGNDVYELALSFIIERAVFYLDDFENVEKRVHLVIEKRGKKEDRKLSEHYQKILARGTGFVSPERIKSLKLTLNFRSKLQNVNGLQLADLIAYPIARYVIDDKRANPAYDLIAPRIYTKNGKTYGLKVFP